MSAAEPALADLPQRAPASDRVPLSRRLSSRLLRSELRLIAGRRRNQMGLLVLAAVPVLIAVAVRISSPREGRGPDFLSSITSNGLFVPLAALPTWLQPIAEWNPTSTLTNALRELWGNPNPSTSDSLAQSEPILVTLVWVVVFIVVFAPLSVRKFRSINR